MTRSAGGRKRTRAGTCVRCRGVRVRQLVVVRPMSPVPLLFVDHAQACGGAEHWLRLLLEELDRRRFVPHLACPPGDLAQAARAGGTTVHAVPLPRLWGEPAAPW